MHEYYCSYESNFRTSLNDTFAESTNVQMAEKSELRTEIKSRAIKIDELKDRRSSMSLTSVQSHHEHLQRKTRFEGR